MSSANLVRCNSCREWFAAVEVECPECGHARPGFSKPLRTAKLNNHLYGMAERADREAKFERSVARGA